MEIKLFGKTLFQSKKAKIDSLFFQSNETIKNSKYLLDFYERRGSNNILDSFVELQVTSEKAINLLEKGKKRKNTKKPVPAKILTPKDVYNLSMLNDKAFKLNVDPIYIDQQLSDFKDKLSMLNSEEYDMRNGLDEISSIISRLENRKKYAENKEMFEEFPYTTSSKIGELVKAQTNLQLGKIAQFIADLPKEAVDVMKKYNQATSKVCGKQAVFYIIADKKDFKKSDNRRDPILLAQSPFGHVWQILGAWDKEMMFLEEL